MIQNICILAKNALLLLSESDGCVYPGIFSSSPSGSSTAASKIQLKSKRLYLRHNITPKKKINMLHGGGEGKSLPVLVKFLRVKKISDLPES